jgi:hypothetical protein
MRVARLVVVASLFGSAVLCVHTSPVEAQVTTSTLRGTVKSADDGVVMGGVEVTLVDESTGFTRTTATDGEGNFAFNNLPVGGPYHVTASLTGFKSIEEKNIFLTSNKTRDLALGMQLQTEVIEISGNSTVRATSSKTVVTAAEIDELPSVSRDPRDVVRRNPEVSVEGRDKTLSIGGNNSRYNSITVDGIRQDDDFGLNTSGYPTRRSPISLSAVEELTVESAPFDVHYGKFLAGNVNIVTKSGTNEFKGTLLTTYSSDALLGNRTRDNQLNLDYSEYRYGGTIGGPIIKDKVFFLASVEGLNATTPVDRGVVGSGAANITSKVSADELAAVQRISDQVYKFNAGDPATSTNEGDLKILGKIDWAIDKQNRAAFSYQRTGGNQIQAQTASDTSMPLTSNWYDARDTLNTFSGRVFSDWSDDLSTEVEFNAKLVSSKVPPLNGNGFMQAQITTCAETMAGSPTLSCPAGAPTGSITLGPDQFRHANSLADDVYHAKAEANYLLPAGNLLTGGVEWEMLRINNLFVPASNGVAQYASVADFMNRTPSSINYQNAVTLNPQDAAAKWSNITWSGYVQDQVKLSPDLTAQIGARAEVYQSGDRITLNPNFVKRYADTLGIENNDTLDGRMIVMPRLGFSYLPTERLNLRAGIGLYSGGTPSVWVSNDYSNDGVRISNVTSRDPAVIDNFNGRDIPQALKDQVKAGNGNVNALDPNFQLPSSWKAGTGADYTFDIPGAPDYGKNVGLKLNYTYSVVRDGVNWVDLRRNLAVLPNNTPIGTTPDGRPLYSASFNTTRGSDLELTNTHHGYGHVASILIDKGFPFGLYVSGSYAYQNVHEVSPATASTAASNYDQTAVVDPNSPSDATSNYQRAHRFTGAIEYSHSVVSYLTDASPWKDMRTSFGMFVESRSGQPYSWTFGATEDPGSNGRAESTGTKLSRIFGEDSSFASHNRELIYVPTEDEVCTGTLGAAGLPSTCKVVLSTGPKGITVDQFNKFLNTTGLSKYRGQIAPRNAFHSPWFNKFDVRIAQDLPNPLSGQRARFVIDIENIGNLLDHNWGRAQATPFPYIAPALDLDYDRASNKYVYSNLRSTNPTTVDVLQSVWRVSLGLMYDF